VHSATALQPLLQDWFEKDVLVLPGNLFGIDGNSVIMMDLVAPIDLPSQFDFTASVYSWPAAKLPCS